jgi:hypothetical protein
VQEEHEQSGSAQHAADAAFHPPVWIAEKQTDSLIWV